MTRSSTQVGLLDQLLPVYCCTDALFYAALAFDSTGTEAHPATDSRTGHCTVTPRHMTTLT